MPAGQILNKQGFWGPYTFRYTDKDFSIPQMKFTVDFFRNFLFFSSWVLILSFSAPSMAEDADLAYQQGVTLQKERQTEAAIRAYKRALALNPRHGAAHYEIGWSYWVREQWPETVHHWQKAKQFGVKNSELDRYLDEARASLEGIQPPLVRVPIHTRSSAKLTNGKTLTLELIARFQHYNPRPTHKADHYDPYVFSPKSVRFSIDGSKAYVNALEGFTTLVFDPRTLKRRGKILHRFRERHAYLFHDEATGQSWFPFPAEAPEEPNIFSGKPVESALSVDGKYLWVPYYRRDYDRYSVMPSALAIIDVARDRIIRVMATGPIPKYIATSPDGNWVAVIHWGNNTVGLIDTRDPDPANYRHQTLIVVGNRIDLTSIDNRDRDHGCGFCLRGAVFTSDSKYLLVARMGGGGIAVLDIQSQRYLGTVKGMRQTPRHLILSSDGKTLFLSSSFAGYVSSYRVSDLVNTARRRQYLLAPLRESYTGSATRTIAISPDDKLIFAAVNKESKIVVLAADTLAPQLNIPADSYPVGMDVSPDGKQLWVTSQGRKRRGGNSVTVYRIRYD